MDMPTPSWPRRLGVLSAALGLLGFLLLGVALLGSGLGLSPVRDPSVVAAPAPPTPAPVVVETPEAVVAPSTQTATATPSPSDGLQEARTLLGKGDAGRAIEVLEMLTRRDGTSPELDETLYQAYLKHGQATLGRHDLDLSYAMFAEAARLKPNDPAAHDGQKQVVLAKAWAWMEATWTTDPDASLAALEEIVLLDPNYREARPKLYAQLVGEAKRLIQANRRADALPVLQRAIEVSTNGDEARQLLLSYTPTPAPTPRPQPTPTTLQDSGAVSAPVPQPSGPSARSVLSAHAIAHRMVAAGDSVTLTYEVTNPGSTPVTAILGASIRPISGGPWINDPANDKRLTFPPGKSSHTRVFRVPIGTPAGRYDVAWGLFGDGRQGWGPAVESGVLTIIQ